MSNAALASRAPRVVVFGRAARRMIALVCLAAGAFGARTGAGREQRDRARGTFGRDHLRA
jgi:hypothetical protein